MSSLLRLLTVLGVAGEQDQRVKLNLPAAEDHGTVAHIVDGIAMLHEERLLWATLPGSYCTRRGLPVNNHMPLCMHFQKSGVLGAEPELNGAMFGTLSVVRKSCNKGLRGQMQSTRQVEA